MLLATKLWLRFFNFCLGTYRLSHGLSKSKKRGKIITKLWKFTCCLNLTFVCCFLRLTAVLKTIDGLLQCSCLSLVYFFLLIRCFRDSKMKRESVTDATPPESGETNQQGPVKIEKTLPPQTQGKIASIAQSSLSDEATQSLPPSTEKNEGCKGKEESAADASLSTSSETGGITGDSKRNNCTATPSTGRPTPAAEKNSLSFRKPYSIVPCLSFFSVVLPPFEVLAGWWVT